MGANNGAAVDALAPSAAVGNVAVAPASSVVTNALAAGAADGSAATATGQIVAAPAAPVRAGHALLGLSEGVRKEAVGWLASKAAGVPPEQRIVIPMDAIAPVALLCQPLGAVSTGLLNAPTKKPLVAWPIAEDLVAPTLGTDAVVLLYTRADRMLAGYRGTDVRPSAVIPLFAAAGTAGYLRTNNAASAGTLALALNAGATADEEAAITRVVEMLTERGVRFEAGLALPAIFNLGSLAAGASIMDPPRPTEIAPGILYVARGQGSSCRSMRIKGMMALPQARVDAAGATASGTTADYTTLATVGSGPTGLVSHYATRSSVLVLLPCAVSPWPPRGLPQYRSVKIVSFSDPIPFLSFFGEPYLCAALGSRTLAGFFPFKEGFSCLMAVAIFRQTHIYEQHHIINWLLQSWSSRSALFRKLRFAHHLFFCVSLLQMKIICLLSSRNFGGCWVLHPSDIADRCYKQLAPGILMGFKWDLNGILMGFKLGLNGI